MTEEPDLSRYQHMWTTEKDDWELHMQRDTDRNVLPVFTFYHIPTGEALFIEDDDVYFGVVQQMLKAGNQRVDQS